MRRAIPPLLLIFLIQCVLVAVVYWPESAVPEQATTATRLTLAMPDTIDEIHIGDEYDNQAVLQRAGDRWILPELQELPADNARVNDLLQRIVKEDPGWPVANTIAARQRFQVADYHYQRQVKLFAEGELADTIFLGTAPAFRKVHARNADQDAIFSLTLNNFDVPALDTAWLDRKLLQIRAPLSISADAYSVNRREGEWRAGTGGIPDDRELQALLGTLRNLQVEGVASEDVQRELSQAAAELVLQIERLAGNVMLELFSLEGRPYIYSSEFTLFFRLSPYDFDRLTGIDFMRISGAAP